EVEPIAIGLEKLTAVRNRVCHSRPLEADDFPSLHDFALDLVKRHASFGWDDLNGTIKLLRTDPGAVLSLAIPDFWSIDVFTVPNNLPLPEFDDTGFLGRVTDRREVRKLLLLPHPVITIVGEGGVGKTALTLRCVYDLLEAGSKLPYDAVIWTSLKTRMLTASGARDIQSAITTNLGLIRAVAGELGSPIVESSEIAAILEDIRTYLEEFKILLVLDNLETVAWQELRPLLSAVPIGSKICITSRVGLGELEIRYPLDPLDATTAVSL